MRTKSFIKGNEKLPKRELKKLASIIGTQKVFDMESVINTLNILYIRQVDNIIMQKRETDGKIPKADWVDGLCFIADDYIWKDICGVEEYNEDVRDTMHAWRTVFNYGLGNIVYRYLTGGFPVGWWWNSACRQNPSRPDVHPGQIERLKFLRVCINACRQI